ncbi:MAG: thiamine phosphate synthase [Planctomycetes bacterium]|nr:thiamine phosphate synthase [Planctomycetota bacterium]
MTIYYRILDANLDRVTEALRVIEDYSRFVLNNRAISIQIKELRHRIFKILSGDSAEWIISRNIKNDLTKYYDIASKTSSLTARNCSRVKESLRSIEEALKAYSFSKSNAIRQIRFEFYSIEKKLLSLRHKYDDKLRDARLYFILSTEHAKNKKALTSFAKKAVSGGADLIQFRDKFLSDNIKISLLQELKKISSENGIPLLVNDRADLCLLTKCDGVHIGSSDISPEMCRQLIGDDKIVGYTAHNLKEINNADSKPISYLAYGTFFKSKTKQRLTLNHSEWKHMTASKKPLFAVGGINLSNIQKLRSYGINKVAICSAIMLSKNPISITKEIKAVLSS